MGSLHIETNSQPVLDTDPATYLATHLGSELLCGTVGIQFRQFRCLEAVRSGSSSLRFWGPGASHNAPERSDTRPGAYPPPVSEACGAEAPTPTPPPVPPSSVPLPPLRPGRHSRIEAFRRFRCPEAVLSGSSSLRSISVRSEFGWQRRLDPRRNRAQHSSTRHDASQFITARRITAQHLSRYITIDPSSISSACRLVRCLERFPCFTFLDSFPGSLVNHFTHICIDCPSPGARTPFVFYVYSYRLPLSWGSNPFCVLRIFV